MQAAIHAAHPNARRWVVCSNELNYSISNTPIPDLLKNVFAAKLHVLYYSGDVDIATVATPTTEECLQEVNDTYKQDITKAWGKWTVNGWHVGYYEQYSS